MACLHGGDRFVDCSCPFIDLNDTRCSTHFTLGRLDEAFDLCLNHQHRSCPTYHRLQRERHGTVNIQEESRPVALTLNGGSPRHASSVGAASF